MKRSGERAKRRLLWPTCMLLEHSLFIIHAASMLFFRKRIACEELNYVLGRNGHRAFVWRSALVCQFRRFSDRARRSRFHRPTPSLGARRDHPTPVCGIPTSTAVFPLRLPQSVSPVRSGRPFQAGISSAFPLALPPAFPPWPPPLLFLKTKRTNERTIERSLFAFPPADSGQAQRRDGPAAGKAPRVSVLQGAGGAIVPPGARLPHGLHRLLSPVYTARGETCLTACLFLADGLPKPTSVSLFPVPVPACQYPERSTLDCSQVPR